MVSRVLLRRWAALVAGVVLLGLAAGCGGEDLSKANFQRTTVTAEPGSGPGDVPTGPITDDAVTLAALRGVDPCALLSQDNLGEIGTVADEPYSGDWGECRVHLRDAGGKAIGLGLTLAEGFVNIDNATGGIEGLPLIEEKADDTTCYVTAATSRAPALGIGFDVTYEGGANPCSPGYTALQQVLKVLYGDPPRYQQPAGSLLGTDPCRTAGQGALTEVLGEGVESEPIALHQCKYAVDGSGPTITVRFRSGYPPDASDGPPVDLGGGVTGYQKKTGIDAPACEIAWLHLATGQDGEDELVGVEFYGYEEQGTKDQACASAAKVARTVVGGLPQR